MTETTTGYSLYSTRDYMRCVCDAWGQDIDNCLVAVPDPTDTGTGSSASTMSPLLTATVTLAVLYSSSAF